MEQSAVTKLLRVQNRVMQDRGYRMLLEEFETVNQHLLESLPKMEPSHRAAVLDYIGILGEINRKMLIAVLAEPEGENRS